ncbi:MAG: hypothetical protein NTV14_03535 [Coprothermobacterota bacterium]|nr:hypothetical protein [Coprothermobacterota bacterium]
MDTVARSFPLMFIWLDLAWLVIFVAILIGTRRFQALLAGIAGGILYFLVDYGIFYLALGTRVVTGADTFWLLLWLSFSYGLTNFAWIWLLLDRDRLATEWSILIVSAWLAVAFLSQNLSGGSPTIHISRGAASYHGVMALILFAGYGLLSVSNIRARAQQAATVSIPRLLAIGIGVQLAWESVLLLSGIRPAGISTLIVNSLIETNLGVPYLFWIHKALSRRWQEDLRLVQKKA